MAPSNQNSQADSTKPPAESSNSSGDGDDAGQPVISPRQQRIDTATAYLCTASGPCRSIGDVYLACVATAGLGMCKSYRHAYQNCTKKCSGTIGRDMLQGLGEQACSHIECTNEQTKEDDKMSCAAGFVMSQMMAAAQQGPTRLVETYCDCNIRLPPWSHQSVTSRQSCTVEMRNEYKNLSKLLTFTPDSTN